MVRWLEAFKEKKFSKYVLPEIKTTSAAMFGI
jgi:hypothetical protein